MTASHIQAGERLSLPRGVKGWRGIDIAEIELAEREGYWIWATGFALFTGDHWGSFSPLWDDEKHRAPSRAEAIGAASAHLRDRLGHRASEYADVRSILSWLDGLNPKQADLFGEAM